MKWNYVIMNPPYGMGTSTIHLQFVDKCLDIVEQQIVIMPFKFIYKTHKIYDKFKNNDPLYNMTVKDYSKLSNLSAKENYNINKSLQLKLVKEDDSYTDYYAMTCGFKNKKELMKYTKAVIKLANKVK